MHDRDARSCCGECELLVSKRVPGESTTISLHAFDCGDRIGA